MKRINRSASGPPMLCIGHGQNAKVAKIICPRVIARSSILSGVLKLWLQHEVEGATKQP